MTVPAKVAACFKAAGFQFDISHFDHRLIAQKLVFLLEELGVGMGYKNTFNFYLRGTYSPTLAKDLFQKVDQAVVGEDNLLSVAEVAGIAKLRQAVDLRPHLLEVMAAYRFLRNQGNSEMEAIKTIKSAKPFLSERDVAIGISKCKGIFPEIAPQDIADLDAEMAPWDAALPPVD